MIQLIGYGNPGRCDDGLGQALAGRIASAHLPGVSVRADYQLTVDHALLASRAGTMVFADAALSGTGRFRFAEIRPSTSHGLTSHSLCPAAVLALAETLFGAAPQAFVLGITGQAFGEVKEGLSPVATANLTAAEEFLLDWLSARVNAQDARGVAHA